MNRSIVCGVDGTQVSRWAARVAGEFARELDTELRVVFGEPADGLMAAALDGDAELLVVGSRGRGPVAAVEGITLSEATVRVIAAKDGTAGRSSSGIEQPPDSWAKRRRGRFSTGIEQLPDTPARRRRGRFSTGIERRRAKQHTLHVGSFSDGAGRLPDAAATRRVGSFADTDMGASA